MSTVIVYFSKSNNTKTGAKFLAEHLKAHMIELIEKKARKGLYGFIKSGFQAVTKKCSELTGDPWNLIYAYSDIYLMTPIWAANGTPAMNRFVSKTDFTGRNVVLITFQSDIKKESSVKVHNYYKSMIEDKGGKSFTAIALHSALPGRYAGEEYIHTQVKEVLNSKSLRWQYDI